MPQHPASLAATVAMGLPKRREASTRYLTAFVEKMKASGFVSSVLIGYGIDGAAVAARIEP